MTITKRVDLGRPLTWDELDSNFEQVDSLVTSAANAVNVATTQANAAAQSATLAAQSSQTAQTAAASAQSAVNTAINSLTQSLASDAGASSIGYKLNANSISRIVSDKLREFVSVDDYGAKGDGSTIDDNAFQIAFTYSRKIMLTPGKEYVMRFYLVMVPALNT